MIHFNVIKTILPGLLIGLACAFAAGAIWQREVARHFVADSTMIRNAPSHDLPLVSAPISDDALTDEMIRASSDASNVIGLAVRDSQQPQLRSLSQQLLSYQRQEIQSLDQYSQQRSVSHNP